MSFTDLDQSSKINIFKSISTTFESSSLFYAAGAAAKIGSSLKVNHQRQI
jgi:hypothetical protein